MEPCESVFAAPLPLALVDAASFFLPFFSPQTTALVQYNTAKFMAATPYSVDLCRNLSRSPRSTLPLSRRADSPFSLHVRLFSEGSRLRRPGPRSQGLRLRGRRPHGEMFVSLSLPPFDAFLNSSFLSSLCPFRFPGQAHAAGLNSSMQADVANGSQTEVEGRSPLPFPSLTLSRPFVAPIDPFSFVQLFSISYSHPRHPPPRSQAPGHVSPHPRDALLLHEGGRPQACRQGEREVKAAEGECDVFVAAASEQGWGYKQGARARARADLRKRERTGELDRGARRCEIGVGGGEEERE